MKYIYWFKQQAIAFTFITLWTAIIYGITCKFGWREAIVLTPDRIVSLLSMSLTFIFIVPFIYKWWEPLKK